MGVRDNTITVEDGEGTAQTYAISALHRFERRRGTRSYWYLGAPLGFVAGTAVAWAALHSGGSTSLCDLSANQDAIEPNECLGLSALVGGLPGAGVGALVGLLIKSDRWEEVARNGLSVVPVHLSGTRIQVAFDFSF